MEVIFTQVSAKKYVEKIEERLIVAIVKEFRQLNKGVFPGKFVVESVSHEDLTKEQKKIALEAIHLRKEKHNGIIKGHNYADESNKLKCLKEGGEQYY